MMGGDRIRQGSAGRWLRLAHLLSGRVAPGVAVAVAASLCLLQFLIVPAFYHFNTPVAELGNMLAASTQSAAATGSLWVCGGEPTANGCAFAYRMPLIPYAYAGAMALVGDNVLRIAALKTALLDLLLLYVLRRFLAAVGADRLSLLVLAAALSGPQFMLHAFSPDAEEGFLIQLLAVLLMIQLLFALRRENELPGWARLPALVAVSGAVYLAKSSMILLIAWNVVFVLWFLDARTWIRAAAATGLCVPVLLWGLVVEHETGHFAVGTSIDGLNLLGGNNPVALDFYPRYSDDYEIGDGPIELDGKMVERLRLADVDPRLGRSEWPNEWAYDDALRDAAVAWAVAHPSEELRLLGRKLWVLFFEIRNSPITPGTPKPPPIALAVGMAWMAVMRVILWAAILLAARAALRAGRQRAAGVAFLAFIACYAAPYAVGFGFERHVVPMLLPAALFLVLAWRLRDDGKAAA